jgi:hypothetical protein
MLSVLTLTPFCGVVWATGFRNPPPAATQERLRVVLARGSLDKINLTVSVKVLNVRYNSICVVIIIVSVKTRTHSGSMV